MVKRLDLEFRKTCAKIPVLLPSLTQTELFSLLGGERDDRFYEGGAEGVSRIRSSC